MAVIETQNASSMKIKFYCGVDLDGNRIMRTNTYNSIKPAASNENLMAVANAILGLQQHDLEAVTRVDNTSLSE